MKKIIISFLLTICLTCVLVVNNVSAEVMDGDSSYIVDRSKVSVDYIKGGGTVYKQSANTYYDGYLDKTSKYYKLAPQTYQWVEMPASSEDIKTVVWSHGSIDGFQSSTTTLTAKNYEETHPGWIVVAAANGDWFRINDTCEATNLMVQDGEVIRPFVYYNVDWRQVIGWSDGGNPIIGEPTINNFMSLHTYNDLESYTENFRNENDNIKIAGYNTTPTESGVYLFTKDARDTFDLTGYTVYVGQYDLCRVEYDSRKPFVKGTILSVVDNLGVCKPEASIGSKYVREFYLATKDDSLKGKLEIGNYVKCQFDLNGEWSNVTDACGYVNQCLSNYQPLWGESCDKYGQYDEKTAVKPRMIIGFKEDGTTVFMDIDGRDEVNGHTGLSCFEAGELMRLAGCKNAYNLDGGGSATLIVRNEYNDFDIVNIPSDGSERRIGNAILFVMRDPGISWDVKNTTRNEVIFNKVDTEFANLVTDVKVTIDGITADMVDNKAVVKGLKEDTEYVATVTYKVPSEKDPSKLVSGSYKVKVKTKAFEIPGSGVVFEDINKNSVKVVKRDTEYSSWIKDISIVIDGTDYPMGDQKEMTIAYLLDDTEYEVTINYTVNDPESGNEYHGSETRKIKTLSFELPKITDFSLVKEYSNRVSIKYGYSDDDEVVTKAVIMCNDVEYKLSSKAGAQLINDLDLANTEYVLKLIVTYKNGKVLDEIESKEIRVGKGAVTEIKHSITYELDGGKLEGAPTEYVEGKGLTSLPTPTKEGYEFEGWYYNGNKVTEISKNLTEDVVLTAKWKEVKKKGGCNLTAVSSYLVTFIVTLSGLVIVLRKRK